MSAIFYCLSCRYESQRFPEKMTLDVGYNSIINTLIEQLKVTRNSNIDVGNILLVLIVYIKYLV